MTIVAGAGFWLLGPVLLAFAAFAAFSAFSALAALAAFAALVALAAFAALAATAAFAAGVRRLAVGFDVPVFVAVPALYAFAWCGAFEFAPLAHGVC